MSTAGCQSLTLKSSRQAWSSSCCPGWNIVNVPIHNSHRKIHKLCSQNNSCQKKKKKKAIQCRGRAGRCESDQPPVRPEGICWTINDARMLVNHSYWVVWNRSATCSRCANTLRRKKMQRWATVAAIFFIFIFFNLGFGLVWLFWRVRAPRTRIWKLESKSKKYKIPHSEDETERRWRQAAMAWAGRREEQQGNVRTMSGGGGVLARHDTARLTSE